MFKADPRTTDNRSSQSNLSDAECDRIISRRSANRYVLYLRVRSRGAIRGHHAARIHTTESPTVHSAADECQGTSHITTQQQSA